MICPQCGHDNVPGSEECSSCLQDLTQLDRPVAHDRVERTLMEDAVHILSPRKPITVHSSTSIRDAIQTLVANNVGALLVVDGAGKLLGILSERDLLSKLTTPAEHFVELPVSQCMTANPETVTSEDTLAFALHKMDVGGYRHLPVVTNNHPTGVISVRDVLRYITRLCK